MMTFSFTVSGHYVFSLYEKESHEWQLKTSHLYSLEEKSQVSNNILT